MTEMIDRAGLKVAATLVRFLEARALPGTGVEPEAFWRGAADLFARFAPENRALLAVRDDLQARIDAWHEARRGQAIEPAAYQAFLREIGYGGRGRGGADPHGGQGRRPERRRPALPADVGQ